MSDQVLLKRLVTYVKPYKWQIVLILVLLPLGSLSYSVQPMLIQKAVDGPLLQGDISGLWGYVGLFGLAIAMNFLIQVAQFWLVNSTGQNVVSNIRQDLFEHLEKLSMSFFDRTPVGRSVSRVTSDVEKLSDSFAGGLVLVSLDLFNILGMLAFMFYLNAKLSFSVLCFLIPIIFITIYYQRKYRKSDLKSAEELSKLNSFLQQNIVGISVVQVLNSAKKSMEKFSKNNLKYFQENNACVQADAQLSAIIEFISFLATAVLVYLSAEMIYSFDKNSGLVSIGVILAFLQYAQALFEPIRSLSDRSAIILSAFTAIKRIEELLEEEPEIKDPVYPEEIFNKAKEGIPLIEFDDVWFRYSGSHDESWVLKGLSFKIEQGQKVAFVGRTGSGKSTIIKLLTRLYEPEKGSIKINGVSIDQYTQSDLREKLAVIHQDSYIFAGNLEDNIKLGRAKESLDFDFVHPLVELSNQDLSKELSERASNISSGEEQVINFARALITKPEILILDEATAKIDIKTEATIQKTLKEFLKEKTAIVIAHRLDTIKSSDLIIVLNDGIVIEKGSHQDLVRLNGVYASLLKMKT